MDSSRRIALPMILLLIITFLSCASKPEEQIQLAQKAMDQAKEQYAQEFAPTDWKNAVQAWEDAQGLIARESYGEARPLLLRAKSRFEKARDIAKGRRDELFKEIQGIQKAIDIRYRGVKTTLETAKLSTKAKKSLEDACKDIDSAIEKLNAEVASGDYTPAKFTAQRTLRAVYEAEKELQGGKK